MLSTCSCLAHWRPIRISSLSPLLCCSNNDNDDSFSKPSQFAYDPSRVLLRLEAEIKPRNGTIDKPKSWFGPNGQYIKELPCPSCRGRGYTLCTECGIQGSRLDCSQCNGKGIITCRGCLGERVIWEESIDEQPWEKARSVSPLKVKEDDEVDNLEIKLDMKKKSKRVYQSPPPEVGQKISRSLKSLNAKTGLFSKRMKIIHRNPILHAQRVAAIKKAKGTAAARKHASETLKAFFSDPENRHKRSIAMKGVKFYCGNCGREGHRTFYCPEFKDSSIDRRFRCRLCGVKGHNKRTCPKSRTANQESIVQRHHRCKICHQSGHNHRTCPKLMTSNPKRTVRKRRPQCRICHKSGHNRKTCPELNLDGSKLVGSHTSGSKIYTCSLCKGKGHNVRTCPNRKTGPAITAGTS
ncbi:uncharacterized protein LOC126688366 [Mercurialis annua]|uniref:uncharacterized protein LOC126688366 n=1 Tax=Mercurialis annua TaxID=3986 RepID=UPI00215F7A54|nr:uncharacterized protein LOC126688366 [Mercurialis annua]XP_050238989.1 uncharacterized protein LOC126688366 [Mercurialis annua]